MNNIQKIDRKNIILYGIGDLFGGGAFLIIGTLYMIFLTDIVGLNPGRAGTVLVIGKIWDAVSDPLMGYLSDHTNTKYGKRRIYFLIGIIPIAISFTLLWYPVEFSSQLYLFLYYSFAYIFFSTIFTLVMVPYTALNADMTSDFKIRTKLSTSRMLFSQISALIAGVLPKMLIDFLLKNSITPNEPSAYFIMGIIFGIFYSLPWILVFWGTKELPENYIEKREKLTTKLKNFKTIFKNKSFRIHLLMYIFAYLAMDFVMALFIYYLNYYLQLPDLFSYCMLAILTSQIIMLPVYMKISNKFGKAKAYIIGLTIWGLSMLSLLFLGTNTPIYLIILICIFIGAGLSAGVMIPYAILPSITDVDEVMTLKKRTGVYSGLMTLIRKMAQAIAMWSIGLILSLIGYIPNQSQSIKTLFNLKMVFIFIPVIFILAGIISAFKFKITPKKQKILRKEINRLRSGGKRKEVSPKVKKVCEELTGNNYFSK
ncbi:MAG: MFS transporter [Bacillota bacterium]